MFEHKTEALSAALSTPQHSCHPILGSSEEGKVSPRKDEGKRHIRNTMSGLKDQLHADDAFPCCNPAT